MPSFDIFALVNSVNDANPGQGHLQKVDKMDNKWQIKCNYQKCNHMHFSKDQHIQTVMKKKLVGILAS